jgi:hypothetical protein
MLEENKRLTDQHKQFVHGGNWARNGAAIEVLNVGEELLQEEVSTVTIQ